MLIAHLCAARGAQAQAIRKPGADAFSHWLLVHSSGLATLSDGRYPSCFFPVTMIRSKPVRDILSSSSQPTEEEGANALLPLDTSPAALEVDAKYRKSGSYHHGNLRTALVECGMHILDTQGIEAMSLRAAARLAGVSQTAPRNHFADKRGLLAAIAAEGFVQLKRGRTLSIRTGMTAGERLYVVVFNYVRFAVDRPALFHLMFGPEISDRTEYPELDARANDSFDLLRSVIADILKERATAYSVETAVSMVWSGMHGLATLLTESRRMPLYQQGKSPEEQCRDLAEVLLTGLVSPPVENVPAIYPATPSL